MIKGLEDYQNEEKIKLIRESGNSLSDEKLRTILSRRTRIEKVAIKDTKLRTFISQDKGRDDLVAHVYDITYGTVRRG